MPVNTNGTTSAPHFAICNCRNNGLTPLSGDSAAQAAELLAGESAGACHLPLAPVPSLRHPDLLATNPPLPTLALPGQRLPFTAAAAAAPSLAQAEEHRDFLCEHDAVRSKLFAAVGRLGGFSAGKWGQALCGRGMLH